MAQADEVRQPELRHRIAAAAGASIVAALLVNPLDVVKTRVQAALIVTDQPLPTCLLSRPSSLSKCQSARLPSKLAEGCMGAAAGPPGGSGGLAAASQLPRRLLMSGQLPMSSCACALKVADLGPERLGAAERCAEAARLYRPVSASGVLRDIVRKEGLAALWRGTDTAMLASIPMVGVYMPMYDYLLQRTTVPLGGYAPLFAGSAARTVAVLLVGPLELVRTRQQGSAGGARTAWAALRETLQEVSAAAAAGRGTVAAVAAAPAEAGAGAASPSVSRLAGGLRLLRSVPQLWRGVGATLARDVPFSAIYWGLMERARGELLARWYHRPSPPPDTSPTGAPMRLESVGGSPQGAIPELGGHQQHGQQEQRPEGPSSRVVLAVNLVAGSASGAVAALVTTPFDVVKTQLQLVGSSRSSGSSSSSSSTGHGGSGGGSGNRGVGSAAAVAGRIFREEGVRGLFRGWGPRAARTAPACAVVVSSYEVLKMLL
ncbi:mitochondrial substrate carrier [Volvox carteri f. nagariensis]|uniref:Mitochondrial substrate carrier n=1 Tax=Volvox carteri f. nagariensis TaxID=3068 RepID=D8TIS8_VOLCA|nr:mitochondrial substrate carrier [Volvox carteri f. nagariensis]EFJ52939.1 mitochondrial substrate carrier [Volvox carteri f. nagariensis]|eukprot:XP_002945944.1 mitochondrial substrate carrier [Volvox carteri f. nagariensis]